MAKTTINNVKVNGDTLTIDATVENTKYRGETVTVNFQGSGSLSEVLKGFIGQQKIAHSGKIEARAFQELKAKGEIKADSLTSATNDEKSKVQARVQEIARTEVNNETVDPFSLDVTPQDLADLLEDVPAEFHGQVRGMYEAHGLEWAEKLAETIQS